MESFRCHNVSYHYDIKCRAAQMGPWGNRLKGEDTLFITTTKLSNDVIVSGIP